MLKKLLLATLLMLPVTLAFQDMPQADPFPGCLPCSEPTRPESNS